VPLSERAIATDEGGRRVEDYADDVRNLSPQAFVYRHGDAFLVHHGAVADLRPPPRAQPTLSEITNVKSTPLAPRASLSSGFLVFEVRSSGRCPFPNMISVGRTRNNDIVIADISVSKFHAFFTRGRDGRLLIQDGGSRNGTWLSGIAVPGREARPMPVSSFSELRFGSVELSFLLTPDFCKFVTRLTRP
jgi:hypothetical protein